MPQRLVPRDARVTAILKLRRGVVQEVGIADKSPPQRRRTEFAFLTSFYSASWKSPAAPGNRLTFSASDGGSSSGNATGDLGGVRDREQGVHLFVIDVAGADLVSHVRQFRCERCADVSVTVVEFTVSKDPSVRAPSKHSGVLSTAAGAKRVSTGVPQ